MKIKFLTFLMISGLSLAMIGCDTTTSVVSPEKPAAIPKQPTKSPKESESVTKDTQPTKTETVKKPQTVGGKQQMATTKTASPKPAQPTKKRTPTPQPTVQKETPTKKKPKVKTEQTAATPKPPSPPEPQVGTLSPTPDQSKKVPPLMIRKEDEPRPEPSVPAPKLEKTEIIPELNVIYFEYDKSRIQDQFKADLQENFEWIKKNPDVKIQLEGHADERGTNEYNLALGDRRGNSILDYLIALGANPEQFSVISFGEERPAMLNCSDEHCYVNNRRVEFTRL